MPKATTKKTVSKAATPVVAKKAVAKKTVAKKAAPTKVAAKKAAAPAKEAAPKKVAVKKAAAKKAPAKKAAASKQPIVTTVIAKIDAGFGNQLYLRGSSSGLIWDAGVLMENVGTDEWVWTSTAVTSELEFKVLLNDETWATGPNGVVFPGATVVFEPTF